MNTDQSEVLNQEETTLDAEVEESGLLEADSGANADAEQVSEEDKGQGQGQSKSANAKARLRRKLAESEAEKARLAEDTQKLHEKLATLESKLETVVNPPPQRPSRVDFESEEQYEDALLDWKIGAPKQEIRQEVSPQVPQAPRLPDDVLENWKDKCFEASEKYSDFNQVAFRTDGLNITTTMSDAIVESDTGAEVAYFLGKNPVEADKIARLTTVQQVHEIEKLAKKFTNSITKAPEPIEVAKGTDNLTGKDPSKMSPDEYRQWRLKSRPAHY